MADHRQDRGPKLNLHLHTRTVAGITLLCCQGRIRNGNETIAFSRSMADLLPHTRQLIIELSGVETIDGDGLGKLVMALMWAQACGCSIKLASARQPVQEMLESTNLVSAFEIHPTLEQALLCFRGQAA
jgi:anti-anti-sigma factor